VTSDPEKQGIYAISSATGSDHDTMDASLLMSPDYVQPLIPTELATLVEQIFSSNGVSWLRHSVARKYVQWRKSDNPPPARPSSLLRNQTLPPNYLNINPSSSSSSLSPSSLSRSYTNQVLTPPPMGTTSSSYALARLADHTQREERLAQVRLANWAADLQKSLAREREQYAALARGERAIWLAERISECVRDGSLVVADQLHAIGSQGKGRSPGLDFAGAAVGVEEFVPSPSSLRVPRDGWSGQREGEMEREKIQHQNQQHQYQRPRQDPLGLLEVADKLRHKGLVALEVLGGLGVLGGLALWVTRHHIHLQIYGWMVGEWERLWYGAK
jgi:hypothetical protein